MFRAQRSNISASTFKPVIPLVQDKPLINEENKNRFIDFKLKVNAGAAAGAPTYVKHVKTFEEGSPKEWIDLIHHLDEIWRQNSMNEPADRVATVRSILKGESLTAFDVALEERGGTMKTQKTTCQPT
jgi:hypothetical protein